MYIKIEIIIEKSNNQTAIIIMAQIFDHINFDDSFGSMTVKSLNETNINLVYNYNLTTFQAIADEFFNNYKLNDCNNNRISFYSKELFRTIDRDEWCHTPQALGISILSEFKLELSKYTEAKSTDNSDSSEEKPIENIHDTYKNKLLQAESNKEIPLEISVKTLTGKTIPIKLYPTMTIRDLKIYLAINNIAPIDQQRLIYSGMQLEDERTLSDYNIKDAAVIHIVLRLRGGMYHETSGKNGDFKNLKDCIIWVGIDPSELMIVRKPKV
jgi:hypothetical protein